MGPALYRQSVWGGGFTGGIYQGKGCRNCARVFRADRARCYPDSRPVVLSAVIGHGIAPAVAALQSWEGPEHPLSCDRHPHISMSRRRNFNDNAHCPRANGGQGLPESFFQLLKIERIRRRTYLTRDGSRQDMFDDIKMFYNPNRKHTQADFDVDAWRYI